jgi:hypothetical protein
LKGKQPNVQGIGSKVWIYTSGRKQFQEFYPYRGYESSVQPIIHFGLGKTLKVDSLKIIWPDGSEQTEYNIKANQSVRLDIADAHRPKDFPTEAQRVTENLAGIFSDVTGTKGLNYQHKEVEFVDFKVQPLLPHMFSKNGPV